MSKEINEKQFIKGNNKSRDIMISLQEGRFDEVNIEINDWFSYGRYNYIYSVIEGCDKTINYELLEFVTIYLKNMINQYNKLNINKIYKSLGKEIILDFLYKANIKVSKNNTEEKIKETWYTSIFMIIKELLDDIIRVTLNHQQYNNIMLLLDDIDFKQFPIDKIKTKMENISLNNDEYYSIYTNSNKDYKKIEKGQFDKESINYWFSIHDYNLINYAVVKSGNIENINLIHHILEKTLSIMKNTYTTEYTKEELIKLIKDSSTGKNSIEEYSYEELVNEWNYKVKSSCILILINIINISIDNINKSYKYKKIIDKIETLNDNYLNLYICANINYNKYLNHQDKRIRKVANLRRNFEKKWNYFSDNKKERIKWIETALKLGVINTIDGCLIDKEPDKMCVLFESALFKKTQYIYDFDKDIFYTIQNDQRILASKINDLINDGIIELKDEYKPIYFEPPKTNKEYNLK